LRTAPAQGKAKRRIESFCSSSSSTAGSAALTPGHRNHQLPRVSGHAGEGPTLFGQTANQWRDANPKRDGNRPDHAAIEQLLVLANLEGMNAELIPMGLSQGERLKALNAIAIRQMQTLTARPGVRRLGPPTEGNE